MNYYKIMDCKFNCTARRYCAAVRHRSPAGDGVITVIGLEYHRRYGKKKHSNPYIYIYLYSIRLRCAQHCFRRVLFDREKRFLRDGPDEPDDDDDDDDVWEDRFYDFFYFFFFTIIPAITLSKSSFHTPHAQCLYIVHSYTFILYINIICVPRRAPCAVQKILIVHNAKFEKV